MTKKVFGLDTQPGIQRDGTTTDRNFYNDGQWVRFQRARPRKILGYREIASNVAGPSRGIYLDPSNQFSTIYSGFDNGLQSLQINDEGIGSGVIDLSLSNFTFNVNNLWQFDAQFDSSGAGRSLLLAHPGQNLSSINNQVNTPVLAGEIGTNSLSKIGVFTAVGSTNSTTTITLNNANFLVGAGQKVTGSGIPANTYVVSIVGGITILLSNAATATASGVTFTFDNEVAVSGGVVVLHPYVFVYGNNGLIKNSSAGNPNDFVSPDSNETNVASTKIVKGLPVRGGSNSPSGLFWSLDSLIRVSYTPTTVTIGGTTSTFYWRYDIISSQSSILSSQSVIEYDGVYYWCGVDRFLMYNGVVKEVPNAMNQNFFFDNLNYAQRQKVYATKVPRFGEIWWFYPTNGSDECNNAIIYNVREGTWYDAGFALGAQRTAGYFSQVFHFPINAGYTPNLGGAIQTISIINAGSGYTNGVYPYQELTGGSGIAAYATITVAGGIVTSVEITAKGYGYAVGQFLTSALPGGANFEIQINTIQNYITLFQHEIGTDAIIGGNTLAIDSYFETNNLGLVSGGPSQQSLVGENVWLRLERIEPDFVQSGPLDLYVTGRPFAQSEDKVTGPYTFFPDTNKIDMKEQRRELRLKVQSNIVGGDYQLGYMILNADIGDVRGY